MAEALKHNLKLIGRYAILRELRRDRYTAAYLAFDPVLNRELVVKAVQLRPAPGQEASGHDRIDQAFMRQAQAAGRLLHHPHIVTVLDAGRLRNVGYLALEKVDGKLLSVALAEGFRPGVLEATDIVARVADAIEYAHARGVPHGHLGASRIYLQGPERSPRVMGFGGWIDTGVTGDFELAGTEAILPYFEDELGVEARRKDVRALGALLFLLLTGTRPDLQTLRARSSNESAIIDLRPTTPLVLAEIAESALELRDLPPFDTAARMRDALTGYLWGQHETRTLPNAATLTGSPARREIAEPPGSTMPSAPANLRGRATAPRRRRVMAGVGAIVATALALIGFAFAAWSERNGTAGSEGVVALAVAPWGEVYVDGAARGIAPPLRQLTLPAGRHTIEVRNGDRQPYVAQVDVAPDRPQRIAHRFQ